MYKTFNTSILFYVFFGFVFYITNFGLVILIKLKEYILCFAIFDDYIIYIYLLIK